MKTIRLLYFTLFVLCLGIGTIAQAQLFAEPVLLREGTDDETNEQLVLVGSVNGDEFPDVVLRDPTPSVFASEYLVFGQNDGSGDSFVWTVNEEIVLNFAFGLTDLNNDGLSDLIYGAGFYYRNSVDEDFEDRLLTEDISTSYLGHGYVNEDDFVDLILYEFSSPRKIIVAYNDGAGNFLERQTLLTSFNMNNISPFTQYVLVEDFDQNGLNDVVVLPYDNGDSTVVAYQTEISVFETANTPLTQTDGGLNYAFITAGDYDGDGDLDIFHTNQSGLKMLRNDDGQFLELEYLTNEYTRIYKIADLDLDGRTDRIHQVAGEGFEYALRMESGEFGADQLAGGVAFEARAYYHSYALADFDLDGDLDILALRRGDDGFDQYLFENLTINTPNSVHEEAAYQDLLLIYPNPTAGTIRLSADDPSILSECRHLSLSDAQGRVVARLDLQGRTQLDLPVGLAAGAYQYQIRDAKGGLLSVGQLIKR